MPDSSSLVGLTISHYHIRKKLGQGGMGEVYLAQDTALDRTVALKFVLSEVRGGEIARKRLLAEARSAAALDHPFICKVYEAGDVDERHWRAFCREAAADRGHAGRASRRRPRSRSPTWR